ncbi:iron ABC transporter permease [uncultured Phascolarctobacterium sp.]|uniref:FecCD family ABC transporter permease n=1 Tax=uncultured Phascolarctobacterium sp. TaxID=512296 RepID=UPI0025E55054|nr:iron ABC transporter permease [uncultured Phascolarctobacterium sp.]
MRDLKQEYKNENKKKILLIVTVVFIMLVSAYVFTTLGMKNISNMQTLVSISKAFSGTLDNGADAASNKVIMLLRLPRIALAMLAGIGLAVSGAIMQSLTRNYLVSPFTLGISSAAAFGASMSIVFGVGVFFQSEVGMISCAFIASCICGCIVYGISRYIGLNPSSIVLVGISLNYLFSAMTATIEFFAKEHKLEAVVQWTFGSFNRATWESVLITFIVIVVGLAILIIYSLKLNVMATNSDEMAKSLGINVNKARVVCGMTAILLTATIISFTGVIGFVGLIAPHIARLLIGDNHLYYLPFASVLGGILLLFSDMIGKFILYPVNIPVGIVISFLGVPLFIHLILMKRRSLE